MVGSLLNDTLVLRFGSDMGDAFLMEGNMYQLTAG